MCAAFFHIPRIICRCPSCHTTTALDDHAKATHRCANCAEPLSIEDHATREAPMLVRHQVSDTVDQAAYLAG